MVRGQMGKNSSYGKSSDLGLHHKVRVQPDAVKSCRYRFCPNSGSKQTWANAVKLPLGGGQALGRAGSKLPGGFGLLLQQSQDILEDLPV
jgi:hypothetical protein